MKKKVTTMILIIIIFLAGLSLLLYPLVANQWNNHRQKQLISGYEEVVAQKEKDGEINYEQEWENADAYNDSLQPSVLPDSFAVAEASDEENSNYFSCLNLSGDGMMGYIEVPKINIKIPIYHTTEDEVLQKAAGHLEGSSLPVGGKGTHAVISAHRGLPSARLFTNLDKMESGDTFTVTVLDRKLTYQVDQIKIVEPQEINNLTIEEGKDYCTLMTCTPYGINSHRLLVRGERISQEESGNFVMADGYLVNTSAVAIVVAIILLFWILLGLLIWQRFSWKRKKE